MIKYDYWGSSNPPPENLKTTKQLAEIGLKGVKTVAFIETKKYTISLYDINDSNSVPPTLGVNSASNKSVKAF